jgi:hypothetical protein
MHLQDGRNVFGIQLDKTINCIASNYEMNQPSCPAKYVQVIVLALTDLLPNL